MNIRRAEEKDIPRIIELLKQVLQIHAGFGRNQPEHLPAHERVVHHHIGGLQQFICTMLLSADMGSLV